MEEELWYMQAQSRVLQEFRAEIRSLWDDEAARSINRGLLNPHQEDDEEMVGSFVQQHHYLGECEVHRIVAEERAEIAEELSLNLAELIVRIDEDIEVSIQFEEQYRSFSAESKGMLPEIDNLIAQANEIGNGAPPYEP